MDHIPQSGTTPIAIVIPWSMAVFSAAAAQPWIALACAACGTIPSILVHLRHVDKTKEDRLSSARLIAIELRLANLEKDSK